jgi:hypothetical protein
MASDVTVILQCTSFGPSACLRATPALFSPLSFCLNRLCCYTARPDILLALTQPSSLARHFERLYHALTWLSAGLRPA